MPTFEQATQPNPSTQSFEDKRRVNYKRMFLKLANKVRRQRDRYSTFSAGLRQRATDPDVDDTTTDVLLERADQVDRVVADLGYILDRAKEFCTPEDRSTIDNGTY